MRFSTKEEYAQYAKQLFLDGYNCAQAIVLAFSDFTNLSDELSKKLSSPFGGGMGRMREVCGAVSGMFIVLGAVEGYDDVNDSDKKAELYKKVQQLAESFKDDNGSIICRELLGLSEKSDSYIPSERTKEYYESRPCPDKVASAALILADYLLSKEN
ncbi:MAG: C-GCAxxG-C-C family protein [Lachnospiraceae bacterium]|nr:C-GCAxxG-C-C family protein [Lachnospiraceae bacterium]